MEESKILMKKIIKDYRERCEKKIDGLMVCIEPMTRKYTRKELIQFVGVGLLIAGVCMYLFVEYTKLDESAQVMRIIYGGEILTLVWLELYYAVVCLYNQFQTAALRNIYVVFGYTALVFGGFFGAILTVLEMLAQRTNVYHIYKHYYLVFMALPYTMILVTISWKVLCTLETRYTECFDLFDWNFAVWIFFYVVIKYEFLFCLTVGCRFVNVKKEMAKCISDEISTLFYISLMIYMLYIWGTGKLETSENKLFLQGFLNATTVWVRWGTIHDKIGSGITEKCLPI